MYPSFLTKWFTLRKALIAAIGLPLIAYTAIGIIFYPILLTDSETLHQWARDYDPILEIYFDEPTFLFIPHMYHDLVDLPALIFLIVLTTSACLVIAFFIRQMIKTQTIVSGKLQRSLMISSIIQIFSTCFFLFSPYIFFFIFIGYDIRGSASFMCFMMCVFTSHCLVEFIATLYFVSPYRNFIIRLFRKKILKKETATFRTIQVSAITVSRYY